MTTSLDDRIADWFAEWRTRVWQAKAALAVAKRDKWRQRIGTRWWRGRAGEQ